MKLEELISHLQNFGLNQDDAKIYVGLLTAGPSKVGQLSNFTHINRVKAYRILENLKSLGFASSTFSNPTVYSANDLKASIQGLVNEKKSEAERLEKFMNHVVKNYQIPESPIIQTNNPQFAIISGRYNIYMRIEKMIKEETKELYIVMTPSDWGMMYYTSIPECLQKAQKNGMAVRIVTEAEGKNDFEMIKRMEIDNLRMTHLPSRGRIVCGGSESLVSGYTNKISGLNSEEDSALITNSDEFVKNIHCLCWQLWKSGKELYQLENLRGRS